MSVSWHMIAFSCIQTNITVVSTWSSAGNTAEILEVNINLSLQLQTHVGKHKCATLLATINKSTTVYPVFEKYNKELVWIKLLLLKVQGYCNIHVWKRWFIKCYRFRPRTLSTVVLHVDLKIFQTCISFNKTFNCFPFLNAALPARFWSRF